MKKKTKLITFGIILLILVSGYYYSSQPGKHDTLAQCLTEKGAEFYGSYQCSYCAVQKKMFGKSMDHITYIECGPLSGPQTPLCSQKEIKSYPTWIIGGEKYSGVQSIEKLSQLTGCDI